jgi:hypothetical protein
MAGASTGTTSESGGAGVHECVAETPAATSIHLISCGKRAWRTLPAPMTAESRAATAISTIREPGSLMLNGTEGRPAAMLARIATGYQIELARRIPTASPSATESAIRRDRFSTAEKRSE